MEKSKVHKQMHTDAQMRMVCTLCLLVLCRVRYVAQPGLRNHYDVVWKLYIAETRGGHVAEHSVCSGQRRNPL